MTCPKPSGELAHVVILYCEDFLLRARFIRYKTTFLTVARQQQTEYRQLSIYFDMFRDIYDSL